MANSRSARKRIRQNATRRSQNKAYKSMVRTTIKAFEASLKVGATASPAEKFIKLQKAVDTAVRKKLLHRNTAARKISRLSKRLAAVS